MSVKVMGMVFDSYPTGGGEMLLALSLADFADDEGGRVFPSVPTLARKTRQSERSVQYQLRKMEQDGFISIVERSRGGLVRGKKYKSNEYRINIGFLINGAKTAPLEQRCNPAQSTVQFDASNGATAIAPNPSYNSSLYPPPSLCPQHEEVAATNQVQVVVESDELDELVEAAVWVERKNGGKIHKEAGFRRTVRTRILSCGPNPEDIQTLRAWRVVQAAGVENVTTRNQVAAQEKLEIDPVACVKGAKMLSNNILARIGRHAYAG